MRRPVLNVHGRDDASQRLCGLCSLLLSRPRPATDRECTKALRLRRGESVRNTHAGLRCEGPPCFRIRSIPVVNLSPTLTNGDSRLQRLADRPPLDIGAGCTGWKYRQL
jgi:hypothetical protein